MNGYYLGIDTSNYKTSVALVDGDQNIVRNISELLPVKRGERGLRQETALFLHNERLPEMIREIYRAVKPSEIRAVAVSSAPRTEEGSYMPVFLAGIHAGQIISDTLGIPFHTFSHQEGHVEAVMYPMGIGIGESFIFAHLSGGTTEFLLCTKQLSGYETKIIGGTKDISIGQLLDRAGVRLGYGFPAGKDLDRIAFGAEVSALPAKIRIRDGYFNLSGIENQVMLEIGGSGEAVVPGLFRRIVQLLTEESEYLASEYQKDRVYLAGGVAASRTVREAMRKRGDRRPLILFGDPVLSGDNAVGTALLGERKTNGTHDHCGQ